MDLKFGKMQVDYKEFLHNKDKVREHKKRKGRKSNTLMSRRISIRTVMIDLNEISEGFSCGRPIHL